MAGDVSFFSVKTIGLSRTNGRKPCDLLNAARHNLREIQAELGATGRIHPSRSAENVLVAGRDTAEGVVALASSLLASAGIDPGKMRRDRVQALELVVSLPPGAAIDAEAFFARCMAWLAQALPLPVLLATVHRDESAPHLHVLLLPVLDSAYVGGKPIERAALLRLREGFFREVAGPAGLRRDGAKLRGASKALGVAAVLERCEAMGLPAANGPLWPVLVAAIERDPTAAVLALEIDLTACRKDVKPSHKWIDSDDEQNPIGIEHAQSDDDSKPIGIGEAGGKVQSLSLCRDCPNPDLQTAPDSRPGHAATPAEQTPAADHQHPGTGAQPEAIESLAVLWERVGVKMLQCVPAAPQPQTDQPRAIETFDELWQKVGRHVVHSPKLHRDRLPPAGRAGAADRSTPQHSQDRLTVAKSAQAKAIQRHARHAPVLADAGAVRGDDDRVIDREHCHDLMSWND